MSFRNCASDARERACTRLDVANGERLPGESRNNKVRRAADAIADHAGCSCSKRFIHDESPGLCGAWQHTDLSRTIVVAQCHLVYKTREHNVCTEARRLRTTARLLFSRAHNDRRDTRTKSGGSSDDIYRPLL